MVFPCAAASAVRFGDADSCHGRRTEPGPGARGLMRDHHTMSSQRESCMSFSKVKITERSEEVLFHAYQTFISSSGRINSSFPNYRFLPGYPLWTRHTISQCLLHGEKSSFPSKINNNRRSLLFLLPNPRFTII